MGGYGTKPTQLPPRRPVENKVVTPCEAKQWMECLSTQTLPGHQPFDTVSILIAKDEDTRSLDRRLDAEWSRMLDLHARMERFWREVHEFFDSYDRARTTTAPTLDA